MHVLGVFVNLITMMLCTLSLGENIFLMLRSYEYFLLCTVPEIPCHTAGMFSAPSNESNMYRKKYGNNSEKI